MVDFPSSLPPVGGSSFGASPSDQKSRAEQDAKDLATGLDNLNKLLSLLSDKDKHDLASEGSFIGQVIAELSYIKATLAKVAQDQREGKISDAQGQALIGDGRSGGLAGGFYEISRMSSHGVRLEDLMEHLDPPPMTDMGNYCTGLMEERDAHSWMNSTMLPDLKEMANQLRHYTG